MCNINTAQLCKNVLISAKTRVKNKKPFRQEKVPKSLCTNGFGTFLIGASLGIRTPDTLLKRQVLYLLS